MIEVFTGLTNPTKIGILMRLSADINYSKHELILIKVRVNWCLDGNLILGK